VTWFLLQYHTGFRHQVLSWPTNPASYYIESLSSTPPDKAVVADLGCGDAALARALVPKGFRILSFDLVSDNEHVVQADICKKIPLPGGAGDKGGQVVDICICSLSLMSLNWIDCIQEAHRVLKSK
jgi:ribosomal RNA-processing protein 8